MRRAWTIIGVANVARSFRWYQMLLANRKRIPFMMTSGKS
jgi:hypothetical protein